MKLRNFLYLNTKVVEDYIAAIDGYTYDEESQAISTSKENVRYGRFSVNKRSPNLLLIPDACLESLFYF